MPSSRRSAKRPYGAPPPPLDVERARGGLREVSGRDGKWTVRTVRSDDKTYRCPGCNQEIPPGVSHVVAWQSEAAWGREAGVEARRHWHAACFSRR
ncbi:MAG: hypothetical protein FWG11_05910 [Promicromonosporaceae bacterium]|nr:hypothetical protein [Promicromonosporaceae bacterium]